MTSTFKNHIDIADVDGCLPKIWDFNVNLYLHFFGHQGHWYEGSIPHSFFKCLCKFRKCTYDFAHFGHGNWPSPLNRESNVVPIE